MTTTAPDTPTGKAAAATADWLDQRTGIGVAVKGLARKLFPEHWSFMLGEIALYSFITLLLSGVFLTMFFVPSADEVTYNGPWSALQGTSMSAAFASTLKLSFEVRGGLLMRQVHHWAALIFLAAIVTHMMRVFFTGAFRKPREINWVIGFVLLTLGLAAGFSGYSLPDDVLSGNGLRITDGLIRGIPIIGTYMSYFVFGGEFPGNALIPRLFTVHVLLVPGAILALVGLHLALVFLQKHTQFPGSGRTNSNVVGYPLFPVYTAKAGGFFFIVFGVIALMGATMQINPVWNYGPYDPAPVSAGAQPDWYMLFLEGSLRLTPGQLEVVLVKRRFACAEPLCHKRTFVETSEQVPARARVTTRLRQLVLQAVTGAGRAVSEVAAAHGLSWRTVQRCVSAAAELAADPDSVVVRRLGIDEHRYRSVRFFRDPATNAWRRYEPWLGGLIEAIGDMADDWRR